MKHTDPATLIKVPRNKTALMQHLQLLVVRGNAWWCGGTIDRTKLLAFVGKMAARYPIARTERGRSYDRGRGVATVHLVVYPLDEQRAIWWLLSSKGKGGLADPSSPDHCVAKDAMAANGHIAYGDYVLLYAHKKVPQKVPDARTGNDKIVLKDRSTWTWKLTDAAYNEIKASIDNAVHRLAQGHEGGEGRAPWGLNGILAMQRSRPLFSGVRTQVIALHRFAEDRWEKVHGRAKQYGDAPAVGQEASPLHRLCLENVVARLPKMRRISVYSPETCVRNLA